MRAVAKYPKIYKFFIILFLTGYRAGIENILQHSSMPNDKQVLMICGPSTSEVSILAKRYQTNSLLVIREKTGRSGNNIVNLWQYQGGVHNYINPCPKVNLLYGNYFIF